LHATHPSSHAQISALYSRSVMSLRSKCVAVVAAAPTLLWLPLLWPPAGVLAVTGTGSIHADPRARSLEA